MGPTFFAEIGTGKQQSAAPIMDKLNPFLPSRARDRNTTEAQLARSTVFSEIKMVEVSGQLLRVGIRRGKGSSPPLVVFNGIGANLELLEPFVKALNRIEVLAFDVPGIGGSPAPALPYRYPRLVQLTDQPLAELGYDGQVDALGLSWGGMLAQQYAYANPRQCRRLILAATSSGSIMLPGRLSTASRLISPRRYQDAASFKRRAPHIYGRLLRRKADSLDPQVGRVNGGAVIGELISVRLFPVLRENTGKYVDFSLKKTIIHRVRSGNSMAYQWTSLSVKTGKISALLGNEI